MYNLSGDIFWTKTPIIEILPDLPQDNAGNYRACTDLFILKKTMLVQTEYIFIANIYYAT